MRNILLPIFLFCFFLDCKSQSPGDLPDEAIAFLDAQAPPPINTSRVILPNGKTLKVVLAGLRQGRAIAAEPNADEALTRLLALFMEKAIYLVKDSLHKYPSGKDNQAEPLQTGLAYNYNSKDITARKKMHALMCTQKVYGLDCSGFMYQLFEHAGMKGLKKQAVHQATPDTLNVSLARVTDKLKAVGKGKLLSSQIQSGDIIYWDKLGNKAANHIGIALNENGTIKVFQSNGSSTDCNNLNDTRGPRTFSPDDPYWFNRQKSNWRVVRFEKK